MTASRAEVKARKSSSTRLACEPLCPAMIEELVAALSLHSTFASVPSAHATIVLHCETIRQICVCPCSISASTRCSHSRQTQVAPPGSGEWMTMAVRCTCEV